jgi:hypothetical protein
MTKGNKMLSLEERHAERAQRIVANGSEIAALPAVSLGAAASFYRNYELVRNRLNEADIKQLDDQLDTIKEEAAGAISLAEAPDGSGRTMAGIGVINVKVVPAAVSVPEAGNGGGTNVDSVDGWGANDSPSSFVETADTNLGGQALQEQGAGSDLKASKKGAAAPAPAPAPAPAKTA